LVALAYFRFRFALPDCSAAILPFSLM